ncbi:MAG: methyl-accepting chemotaxis protein [Thermodesulfobacteriota bacterium]|nr:methyl-accepting chemotaxis protein [Thermodesulfobacteriota bacterium]
MLKNLKLGTKITGGFIVVLIFTGIISYIGWSGMRGIVAKVEEADDTNRMVKLLLEIRRQEKNLIIREDKKYIEVVKERVNDLKKQANETKAKLKNQDDIKMIDDVLEAVGKYEKAFSRLVEIVGKSMKREERDKLLDAVDKELAEAGRTVEKRCEEALAREKKDMLAEMAWANTLMISGASIAIVLGLLIAFFVTRSITKPINRVVEGLTDGSEQVASASTQVSSASQTLAEGASEQAAGIEETSSSIEEMSSMTKQNADNANQANTLMADTSKVVDEANRSMAELNESMKEISVASEETAKIIKTIDEIAFQTNLLALNAAVEAARAGEAGAGFAVVADEVRNLAMRAADAAKNTANLIEGTVKKIKNGSDIVTKTNGAFTKVAAGAKKVGELVGEISAASSEQAQGVDQINKAVAEMDKVVQKNAASAEESASAAEEMNAQAEVMKGFVGELAAVVGGRNGITNAESRKPGGNGKKHVGLPVRSTQTGLPVHGTQTCQFVSRVTSGVKKKDVKIHPKAMEPKPDHVIPMGEGDFKEF